ncbi:exodeoxyribonuclease VII small subunit [Legionella drozanskii LLAP-1]|uniref:Exodeoxyribonuclease 7 small subunit n=2 Tax=Legionellaceae TaxID=444 RepID=A0A0W0SRQ0_9GAMM|nr:exodeoxyribonuclease VII small subunit [Legionella drozanskii LLAP-1]
MQYTLATLNQDHAMTKPIHFEKSMTELEEIVMQLEKGELSLDDSLKQFEKGIVLARKCQEILQHAEQKIEMLATSATPLSSEISDD